MRTGSEETRCEILDACWRLLSGDEAHQVRMSDVAKEAQVSRQAIYLHFANRAELLIATTRYIDEIEDVAGKFLNINKKNGAARLAAFVEAWCGYIPVIYCGARTIIAGKETDADLAKAWQDRMDALWVACDSVVEELISAGKLRKALTRKLAADILWSTLSVQQWEMLTQDRGWSQKRYVKMTLSNLDFLLVRHG